MDSPEKRIAEPGKESTQAAVNASDISGGVGSPLPGELRDMVLRDYLNSTEARLAWQRDLEISLLRITITVNGAGTAVLAALWDKAMSPLTYTALASCIAVFLLQVSRVVVRRIDWGHTIYEGLAQGIVRVWDRSQLIASDTVPEGILPTAARIYGKGPGYRWSINFSRVLCAATVAALLALVLGKWGVF